MSGLSFYEYRSAAAWFQVGGKRMSGRGLVTVEEALTAIRDIVPRLSASLPLGVDLQGPAQRFKVPGNAHVLREALIWRQEEICRNGLMALDRGDLVVAALLARAALETSALTWFTHDLIAKAIAARSSVGLADRISGLLTGSKAWPELPGAINVLTCIDKLDRLIPGLRNSYDSLSEAAHPNWSGAMGAYGILDEKRLLVRFCREGRSQQTRTAVPAQCLAGALELFESYYNALGDQVPLLVELCRSENPM